jgi:hypothetical protein
VLSSPDALDPESVARTLEPVESALLRLLLVRPYMRETLAGRLTPDMFEAVFLRARALLDG